MGELDGIDPAFHDGYRQCRDLHREHGRTYFLATRLFPADKRAAVHALYGFARMVDDIVDVDPDDAGPVLDELQQRLTDALNGRPPGGDTFGRVLGALADTVTRYDIPHDYFYAFMHSMRMDVPGTDVSRSRYRTMDELSEYMYGSAAVIGLQMLPILGTDTDRDRAAEPAAALGEAFQLTNFIRDMGEDLDRDRIYLPTSELAAFGVDEELLRHCRATGAHDVRVERALAHLIAQTRAIYRTAEPGIDMLVPAVRPAMRTAFVLYGDILRAVEDCGYRVLHQRAKVSRRRRLAVAAPRLAAAGWTSVRERSRLRLPVAPRLR